MEKFSAKCLAVLLVFGLVISGCDKTPSTATTEVTTQGLAPANVLFSFAFVGCNRVQHADKSSSNTNASTANLPELQRTFNEVAALNPKPAFFFFLGDLVLGMESDSAVLGQQLSAWDAQYHDAGFSAMANVGIPMVAIPGNHEMLFERKIKGKNGQPDVKAELPWSGAIGTWMQHMGAFMPSGKLNRVGGPDSLFHLQTYSFDFQNTHFILLNTDTWNPDSTIGTFPVDWVNQDIATARKNPATEHIFLLSHKPAYVNPHDQPDDLLDTTQRASLWPTMEANRVEALLSAHSHQYQRLQPNSNKSYQIVAGNGGSLYSGSVDSEHQFMGYSMIYVMKNGDVILKSMGRDVSAKDYLDPLPTSETTTTRDSVNLRWGSSATPWK